MTVCMGRWWPWVVVLPFLVWACPQTAAVAPGREPDAAMTAWVTPDSGAAGGLDAAWPQGLDAARGDAAVEDAGALHQPDAHAPTDASPARDAQSPADAQTLDAQAGDAQAQPDAAEPVDAHAEPLDAAIPDAALDQDAALARDSGMELPLPAHVRVMAANLSSGNFQSYDPGEGLRIIQALQADVVLIQEFNMGNNSAAALRAFVDQACGLSCDYTRESGAQIPNGVISRFPILESGAWEDTLSPNREFAWARVDVPGAVDLWAVSLHLLTRDEATRAAEAAELLQHLILHVPAGAWVVVGGDLNTATVSEDALMALGTQFSVLPQPDDGTGNHGTNTNRATSAKPYDWVLANAALQATRIPTVVGGDTFPNGLIFDTRVFSPLGSVPPALAGDSAASNMQHMAVVKDFFLPAP